MTIKEKILSIDDYQNKTTDEIASILNHNKQSISVYLSMYDIPHKTMEHKATIPKGSKKVVYDVYNKDIQKKIRDALKDTKMTIAKLCYKTNLLHSVVDKFTLYMYDVAEDDNGYLFLVHNTR